MVISFTAIADVLSWLDLGDSEGSITFDIPIYERRIFEISNADLAAPTEIEQDGVVCSDGLCLANMPAVFTAQAANPSDADINKEISVQWAIYQEDGTFVASTVQSIPELAAHTTHDFEYTWWTVPSSSEYEIFFIVDPGKLIMETNEDNNKTSISIFANVDLAATAIQDDGVVCDDGSCQDDMEATFTAQVVNLSNADINEEIFVRWEVLEGAEILIDFFEESIPGLVAGETYDFEYTWMPPMNPYRWYVIDFIVDPDDSIMEINENNNESSYDALY